MAEMMEQQGPVEQQGPAAEQQGPGALQQEQASLETEKVPTEAQGPELSPQAQKEVQAYNSALSRMLHNPKTSGSIVEMLKAGEPMETVPSTALLVNGQMEAQAIKGGKKPSLEILLNAGIFLCSDLIEIGNAAGIFNLQTEEEVGPIVKTTIQTYIEKGLADGTIDPVELQTLAEPRMTDDHKALGLEAAKGTGISMEADDRVAMQAYGQQMERKGAMKGGK